MHVSCTLLVVKGTSSLPPQYILQITHVLCDLEDCLLMSQIISLIKGIQFFATLPYWIVLFSG